MRVRNPHAIRPWQHVLNPFSGYLVLAERAWADRASAEGYNFGPADEDARPVGWIVEQLAGSRRSTRSSTTARTRTRPAGSSSTPRWPARAGLGARLGPRPRACAAPPTGTAPTARARTCCALTRAQIAAFGG